MKRKHDHEDHMDESWLIPYSDLLTLLLALFIVLFSISNVDKEKMTAMQMAFFEEYNGVMPDPRIGSPGDGGSNDGAAVLEDSAAVPEDAVVPPENTAPEATNAETAATLISVLQEEFASYVELNGLEEEMKIESQEEGLLVTLTSDVWFASGSADINNSQKEIASQISNMIAKVQTESKVLLSVIVSGYTDDVPISGSEFPNNWWLSVTRAVNFMEELMNTSTLNPSNFSARGFGEYEPVDTNDTEEGRRHNRRVEVMISPKVAR